MIISLRSFNLNGRGLRLALRSLLVHNLSASRLRDTLFTSRPNGTMRRAMEKYIFVASVTAVNMVLCLLSSKYPVIWFTLVPILNAGAYGRTYMVLSLSAWYVWQPLLRSPVSSTTKTAASIPLIPTTNEKHSATVSHTISFLVTCYNETQEEITDTLASLCAQKGLDQHRKLLVIVCDGKLKGVGQVKTTADLLQQDIFTDAEIRTTCRGAYRTVTGTDLTLEVQAGTYMGTPYVLIVKEKNCGKRDTLMLVRTLLHKINSGVPVGETTFSTDFFATFKAICACFGIYRHEFLSGTDADTIFEERCAERMLETLLRDERIAGCSGILRIRFRPGNVGFWTLYQHAEYVQGQALRRLHQSNVTGQLSCLPGACQMMRVRESTCGDAIMRHFAYHPKDDDDLITVTRAFAGEDRHAVALLYALSSTDITALCTSASCFTDPPLSWSVFLSQRRRWTIAEQTASIFVALAPGQHNFERYCAVTDLIEGLVPIFRFIFIANAIRSCASSPDNLLHSLVCLSALFILPWLWTVLSIAWAPENNEERIRYAVGLVLLFFCSTPVTLIVTVFTMCNLTDYSWGKTRAMATEKDEAECTPVPIVAAVLSDVTPNEEIASENAAKKKLVLSFSLPSPRRLATRLAHSLPNKPLSFTPHGILVMA